MKKLAFLMIFITASLCITAQVQNSVALDSIITPQQTETEGTTVPVVIKITNVGLDTLYSFYINWTVNGVVQVPLPGYFCLNANGGLPSGFSDIVIIGYLFVVDILDICAWVSMPNGVIDSITHDDTSCVSVESCLPSMFSYMDTLCYGAIYNDDNFSNLTQSGTYYDTLQTIHGCDSIIELNLIVNPIYIMQISDSISAGGSYDFFGKLLSTSGIYYDTLQTFHGCDSIFVLNLSLTSVGIKQLTMEDEQLKIYPNPSNGELRMENGELRVENVEIFDVIGRMQPIGNSPFKEGRGMFVLDISHLQAGIYFIRIQTEKGIITRKIIKE